MRLHRGVGAMVSLTLITVGFLLATGLVIALARRSTARWERAKRASVAVRAAASARQQSPAGARGRAVVAALRSRISGFPPVAVLARSLPTSQRLRTLPGRPIRRLVGFLRSTPVGGTGRARRTKGGSPAPAVDGDEAGTAVAPAPAAADVESGVTGGTTQRLLRRAVPRARRRALALLRRSEEPRDARRPRRSRR